MKRAIIFTALAACAGAVASKSFHMSFKSRDAEFDYSWPSEVSAIPALAQHFTADLRRQRADVIRGGEESVRLSRKYGTGLGLAYSFSARVTTAGQTPRLLSLEKTTTFFSGGAHDNFGNEALLWDRQLNRPMAVSALLINSGDFAPLMRSAYCRALDKERLKRRNGQKLVGEFGKCPNFAELAIAPTAGRRGGPFDRIDFIAAPYVAGPFAESSYDISLPVTAKIIRALKPEYRSSFAVQRQ